MTTLQHDISECNKAGTFRARRRHGSRRHRSSGDSGIWQSRFRVSPPAGAPLNPDRPPAGRLLSSFSVFNADVDCEATHGLAVAILRQAWADAEDGDTAAQQWLCGGAEEPGLRFWCLFISTWRDRSTAGGPGEVRSRLSFEGRGGEQVRLDAECIGQRARRRWGREVAQ